MILSLFMCVLDEIYNVFHFSISLRRQSRGPFHLPEHLRDGGCQVEVAHWKAADNLPTPERPGRAWPRPPVPAPAVKRPAFAMALLAEMPVSAPRAQPAPLYALGRRPPELEVGLQLRGVTRATGALWRRHLGPAGSEASKQASKKACEDDKTAGQKEGSNNVNYTMTSSSPSP